MCLKKEIVLQFLQTLAPLSSHVHADDIIYEPLKGGGSAASLYRVDAGIDSYVLRLLPSHASLKTRTHQIQLAQQAGELGFGPKIRFIDSEMSGIIMQFIQGRTVNKTDFDNLSNLKSFATFLKRLHQSKATFPIAVSPFIRFRDFCLKMEKKNTVFSSRLSEIKTVMEDLDAIFQSLPTDLVPTHLDLHPLNIMLSKNRFILVDWVNGGMGDPYFDLATFCVFLELDEEEMKFFLTCYFERDLIELEWNRFKVALPIRLLVIAAALFSSDADNSMTYEDIMRNMSLPTLSDFGKKGVICPHYILGALMFRTALAYIDQDKFHHSLYNLKTVRCI